MGNKKGRPLIINRNQIIPMSKSKIILSIVALVVILLIVVFVQPDSSEVVKNGNGDKLVEMPTATGDVSDVVDALLVEITAEELALEGEYSEVDLIDFDLEALDGLAFNENEF